MEQKLVRKGRNVLKNTSPSYVTLLQEEDMGLLHAGQGKDMGLPVLHAGQEEDKLAIKYVKNTLLSSCSSRNREQYQH